MAGRVVTISYVGNAASAVRAANEVALANERAALASAAAYEKATGKIGRSFTAAGRLGSNFGLPFTNVLGVLGTKLDETSAKGKNFGSTLSAIGGAELLAAGAGIAFLGTSAVHAADDFEVSHARLVTAVRDTGQNFASASGGVSTLDNSFIKLGFSSAETENALSILTTATHDVSKAQSAMGITADIARARNKDLGDVAVALTKAAQGNYQSLIRLGIATKDQTQNFHSFADVIAYVSRIFGGQASAFADTFAGKLAALKAQSTQLQVTLGTALIPKIEAVASATVSGVQGFEKFNTATHGVAGQAALLGASLPIIGFAATKLAGAVTATAGAFGIETASASAASAATIANTSAVGSNAAARAAATAASTSLASAEGAETAAALASVAADEALAAALDQVAFGGAATADSLAAVTAASTAAATAEARLAAASAAVAAAEGGIAGSAGTAAAATGVLGSSMSIAGAAATGAAAGFVAFVATKDILGHFVNGTSRDVQGLTTSFENLAKQNVVDSVAADALGEHFQKLAGDIRTSQGSTLQKGFGLSGSSHQAVTDIKAVNEALTSLITTAGPSVAFKAFRQLQDALVADGISATVVDQKLDPFLVKLNQANIAARGSSSALKSSASAANQAGFAYLSLAGNAKTAADAIHNVSEAAFKPIRLQISADTAQTSVASALDALNNPQSTGAGDGGGGSGQTGVAAALDQTQKQLSLRDAELGVTDAARGVATAQEAVAQAQRDAGTATLTLFFSQLNLRTVLQGVAKDSQAAKIAIDAYKSAQDAASSSKLDVNQAKRNLEQAKNDKALLGFAVKDAQRQLDQDRKGTPGTPGVTQFVPTPTGSKAITTGGTPGTGPASAEQIAKDEIALRDAQIAASGAADTVRRAEIALSEARIAARQRTRDLTESQRELNGTLHGYPPTSREALDAQNQLTTAQQGARSATDQLATAQRGLITAQNQTEDASLALRRAQADVAGQLNKTGSAAATAGTKFDSLRTRIDAAKGAILDYAEQAAAADISIGHSAGFAFLHEIGILKAYAATSPLLAGVFNQALGQLQAQYLAYLSANAPAAVGPPSGASPYGTDAGGYGPTLPRRATGGPVSAGRDYLVGERGEPEILRMGSRSGQVVPLRPVGTSRGAGGGVVNNWTVNSYSLDPRGAEEAILKVLRDHTDKNGAISGVRVAS